MLRSFLTVLIVRRGIYKNLKAYLAAMARKKSEHVYVADYAVTMLSSVVWAQEVGEEEVVFIRDRDLGLKDRYNLGELTAVAAKFGLHRLDADVAAGLREQYDGQPFADGILCAMDPIAASDQRLRVFHIGLDAGGAFFSSNYASSSDYFDLGNVWAFSRRKP